MWSQSVLWAFHFLCAGVPSLTPASLPSDSTLLPPLQAHFNTQSSFCLKSWWVLLKCPILTVSAYIPRLHGGFSGTYCTSGPSQLLFILVPGFIFILLFHQGLDLCRDWVFLGGCEATFWPPLLSATSFAFNLLSTFFSSQSLKLSHQYLPKNGVVLEPVLRSLCFQCLSLAHGLCTDVQKKKKSLLIVALVPTTLTGT